MNRKLLWTLLIALTTAGLAGCAEDTTEPEETTTGEQFPQEDDDTDVTETIEQDIQEEPGTEQTDTDTSEAIEQDIQEEV